MHVKRLGAEPRNLELNWLDNLTLVITVNIEYFFKHTDMIYYIKYLCNFIEYYFYN